MKELDEKKRLKLVADLPDGHDRVIDELFSVIEDGQAFKNRRRGKKTSKDVFKTKQEALVREKPLPQLIKKPKTRDELV